MNFNRSLCLGFFDFLSQFLGHRMGIFFENYETSKRVVYLLENRGLRLGWHFKQRKKIIENLWKGCVWVLKLVFVLRKGSFTNYVTQKNDFFDPPFPLVTNFPKKEKFCVRTVTNSSTSSPPKKRDVIYERLLISERSIVRVDLSVEFWVVQRAQNYKGYIFK